MPLQEVHTGFTFSWDGSKIGAIQRGVKRASTSLDTIAAKTQVFSEKMGGFLSRARSIVGAYLGYRALRVITTDYAKAGDAVAKFASSLGISAQEYQRVTYAAELNGITVEELNMALPKLAKSAGDAADGSKSMAWAFRRAGVELKEGGKLKGPIQLLTEMADGMKNIEDKGRRTQILMNIFGRAGKKMGVLLDQGSEGIRKAMVEADKLGLVMSTTQLKAAEKFTDEMLRVKSVLIGVRNTIAGKLLPSLSRVLEAFRTWWVEGRNAERALRALKLVAIFTGIVIARLIGASVLRNIKLFVQGIWAGVQALRAMGIAGAATAIKIWAIVAAFALVALAIEDLIGFAQGKDSVIGRILGDTSLAKKLKKALRDVAKAAAKAWKEIKPALLEVWTALKPALREIGVALRPLIGPAFQAAIYLVIGGLKLLAVWIRFNTKWFKKLKSAAVAVGSVAEWIKLQWELAVEAIEGFLGKLKQTAKTIAKAMGIDLSGAATTISKAWKGGIDGIQKALGFLTSSLGRILKLKQAVFGVDIGSLDLAKRKSELKARVEGYAPTTSTGLPIMPGLMQPSAAAMFAPTPALPGGVPFAPVRGGIGADVTANVAAGAVVLNVTAKGDPKAIAAQVAPLVKKGISAAFTNASRDLVKPPRGQS